MFSDTTTSLSPASMETVDAGGLRGGYPAWIINEMIKLDIDPEAASNQCGWRSAKVAALHIELLIVMVNSMVEN